MQEQIVSRMITQENDPDSFFFLGKLTGLIYRWQGSIDVTLHLDDIDRVEDLLYVYAHSDGSDPDYNQVLDAITDNERITADEMVDGILF